MNAIYQYAILEDYSRAAGAVTPVLPPLDPTPQPPTPEPSEPLTEIDPSLPSPEIAQDVATGDSGTTTTTTGDTSIKEEAAVSPTIINIFGAGTSTTSYADQIAVDTATGEVTTSTTDPNAALLPPSIGGGGGFGGGGLGGDEGAAPLARQRTLLPAMAALAGAIFLLVKPLD